MHNKESRENLVQVLRLAIDEELQFIHKKMKVSPSTASYLADLFYIQNNVDCFEITVSDDDTHHDIDPFATMEDELKASQKYLHEYRQTQDTDYLRMAKEELGHAKKFLVVVKNAMPSNPRYQSALSHYNELEAEIRKIT